jgi:hypothetical protein
MEGKYQEEQPVLPGARQEYCDNKLWKDFAL